MIVVEGSIIDLEGEEAGYLVLDAAGRVVERGKPGTLGLGKGEVIRGVALPRMVNGHTHLGDSVWRGQPPRGLLADIVRPPCSLKYRLLEQASRRQKVEAMREVLQFMWEMGTSRTIDFREEGVEGVHALREATRGLDIQSLILGEANDPENIEEVREVIREADGLNLSALKDLPPGVGEAAASEARRKGKFLALHVSEDEREPIDPVLALKPSLLVHLTLATDSDLESVRDAGVPVVFCPRSNALFGRFPPLGVAERMGLRFLLGTDNGMFNLPDLFQEMAFAYLMSRYLGSVVGPESLVRAAFVTPWEVLRCPEMASLQPGSPAQALAFPVPVEDPYYALVARSGLHNRVPLISPAGNRF